MIRKLASIMVVISFSGSLLAHTLFIKPETFFLQPNETARIPLINGTFTQSANRVTTSMMRSVSIVGPGGGETRPDEAQWGYGGKVSYLKADIGEPGNYVIGIETKPRKVLLDPDVFNFYLRYEGLADNEEERVALGETEIAVTERYVKYTKAILQVGEIQTENYARAFGYGVEIIPLVNPYALDVGDTFRARVLMNGEPLTGEHIYATHEGHYPQDEDGIFDEAVKTRSGDDGVIEFELTDPGRWYVRFIHLRRSDEPEYWYSSLLVTLGIEDQRIFYESQWATLTFEIR